MRILVLASDNPSPPINGTRIRNFHLWPELRKEGHEVRVLALTRNPADLSHNTSELEFFTFTKKTFLKRAWMRLCHSYHEWPVSDGLNQRIQQLEQEWRPDIIHAEELRMGGYLPQAKASSAQLSVCVHNVESDLIRKTLAAPFPFAVKLFNHLYRFTLKRFEQRVFAAAHVRMAYSVKDQERYQALYPQFKFSSSSNGVNEFALSSAAQALPQGASLLFLGSLSYLPNIEGLFWFIDEVMPRLKQQIQLTVAGSTPASIVKEKLSKHNIRLVDTPLELAPLYQANSALIVPLLSGSGTRGKILEALMYNRGVLTTTKGVEGLELTQDQGILSADGAEEYAKLVDQWIIMDTSERQSLADRGRKAVRAKYTWANVGHKMMSQWSSYKDASSPSKN